MTQKVDYQPFFYDITLRDGNQALKKPWNTKEKEIIFKQLVELGVQGVEVGFSGASDMDFEACHHLASIAPKDVVISGLARAMEKDIIKVYDAIKHAEKPRIHTFIAFSPFNMEYVLQKKPNDVKKIAIDAVKYAKSLLGDKGDVQFSVEHFGDCGENINFVTDALQEIVEAGATTINLPNTVERTRPADFIEIVSLVRKALPKETTIAVHCHNDLGMATATTVESFFNGARQLECSLNGLGERAGNTNLYEVAISLHNSGVDVPLNLEKIYETSILTAEMSKVEIAEKAPLIGADALAHRSGIHQDGATKTKDMKKGAYRPIHPSLIGRDDDEKIGFTSQSGKTAIYEIISKAGYPITIDEAVKLTPKAKEMAEKLGELPTKTLINLYSSEVFEVKGAFELISFTKQDNLEDEEYKLKFAYKENIFEEIGKGDGPLECCLNALEKANFPQKLLHYEQTALKEDIKGVHSEAITTIQLLKADGEKITCKGKDLSTAKANVKAIFNGLNLMYK